MLQHQEFPGGLTEDTGAECHDRAVAAPGSQFRKAVSAFNNHKARGFENSSVHYGNL